MQHKGIARTAQGFSVAKAVTALGIGMMLATQAPEMPHDTRTLHTVCITSPDENKLPDIFRDITQEDEAEYDEADSPEKVSEALESDSEN